VGVPTCQRRGEPLRYEGVGACPFWPHARPGSRNATPMTRRPTHKPDTARARASPLFPAHVPPLYSFMHGTSHPCPARRTGGGGAMPTCSAWDATMRDVQPAPWPGRRRQIASSSMARIGHGI
jgi:hypothetical protein